MSNRLGRKAKKYPGTYEQLCELVHYDPDTGHMETLGPYTSTGTQMKDGYLHLPVPVDRNSLERGARKVAYYRADHLAWMLVTGEWPTGWMEHINDMRMDNALDNLVNTIRLEDGGYEHWWYGAHSPGEERKLVLVMREAVRVMVNGVAVLKPVPADPSRKLRSVDTRDPHDEDYSYPKGEFGIDWT